MKNYSDSAVTKTDVERAANAAAFEAANAVDEKQQRQIRQLRLAIAVSFTLNLLISISIAFAVF